MYSVSFFFVGRWTKGPPWLSCKQCDPKNLKGPNDNNLPWRFWNLFAFRMTKNPKQLFISENWIVSVNLKKFLTFLHQFWYFSRVQNSFRSKILIWLKRTNKNTFFSESKFFRQNKSKSCTVRFITINSFILQHMKTF